MPSYSSWLPPAGGSASAQACGLPPLPDPVPSQQVRRTHGTLKPASTTLLLRRKLATRRCHAPTPDRAKRPRALRTELRGCSGADRVAVGCACGLRSIVLRL
eukprot:COSAG06_NODE_872_length_11850_cov_8.563952_4_plen_102_part_00